jgi:flagellar basal-body rod modification protein FlgD
MNTNSILGIPRAQDIGTNSTSGSSGSSSSSSSQGSSLQELGPNAFITLLTAQLQAQDPLNPMDPNQMVNELTSMNTLQEMIQVRQDLDGLAAAAGVSTDGSSGPTGSNDNAGSGTQATSGSGSGADAVAALLNNAGTPQSVSGSQPVASAAVSSGLAAMLNSMVSHAQPATGTQANSR